MEKPLTEHIRPDGPPLSLEEYENVGGYQAIRKALREMEPTEVTDLVKEAKLRGRGGAGFPAGLKWSSVPMGKSAPATKFVIVDADEMEPGTFKDRILLEGNPHQLLEGLLLASYAVLANTAFIFLRWEYTLARTILRNAIAEAETAGYIGDRILGSDYSLKVRLHVSAGRYMCGEASAMLTALEGGPAVPWPRSPHATVSGLWGKPTVVNNVETLNSVPHIVNRGADWFKGLSRCSDSGTKMYGVSGRVKNPGCWELPMGVTIREILEEHAGGMQEGLRLRGLLPGGASTDFLVEEHLDICMDFESLHKAGSRLGTGTIIVLDDKTCPVGMVNNLMQFFARESCGWCTPCREGLPWLAKILAAIEAGSGQPDDLEILEEHIELLGMGHTFCALAPGAIEPLKGALKYFREDFERHITEKRCPWSS